MQERIQKILARCGIASRRSAEDMILEGRVTVNGQIAVLGSKADFNEDHIKVDGKLIRKTESKVYIMLNKPEKYITAVKDPEGRPTVMDLLKRVKVSVFPVGRLDYNSEGLLIMTNDGDLANALIHPKNKIPKTYLVKIDGFLQDKDILSLKKGVRLEDGLTAPAKARKVREMSANSWIEITIHEGKKRQIRRMLEQLRHSVIKLKRIRVGSLQLGSLPLGAFRYLTPDEVKMLKSETASVK